MAVRPIDANAMLNELRPVSFEAEHSAVLLSDVSKMMREWVERQPTLTPPNEPLTLEQLREMDGEPVWVETKAGLKFWGIVTKICVSSGDGRYLLITEDTEYGQTWVAYRRPPEGEEDT